MGRRFTYSLRNDVFISDYKGGKPIAYRLTGSLQAGSVWSNEREKLLKFSLESPHLHVRPHKSQSQTEFSQHKSPLDSYSNDEFYAVWENGKITKVFIGEHENEALVNFKKGLVSLFQYQLLDGDHTEDDVSGSCHVKYTSTSPTTYQKLKEKCTKFNGTTYFARPELPLSVVIKRYQGTTYKVSPDGSLDTVESRDFHAVKLAANKNVGSVVDSVISIEWNGKDGHFDTVTASSVSDAVVSLGGLEEQTLESTALASTEEVLSLKKIVKERIDDLDKDKLGTMASAFVLVDILPIVRLSDKKEIVQVLKAKITKPHLVSFLCTIYQICDNFSYECLLLYSHNFSIY